MNKNAPTSGHLTTDYSYGWKTLLYPIAAVIATSVVAWFLVFAGFPSPESLSILFVIPVLFSAILSGLSIALITALVSVLAYNFVLLPPIWHIGLLEAENFTKMVVLCFVAYIANSLAAHIRKLAQEALQREHVISGVYALSQDILGISNVADMRRAAESKLSSLLNTSVHIFMLSDLQKEQVTALYCVEHNIPTGNGTTHYRSDTELYLPLTSHSGAIGVMQLDNTTFEAGLSAKILATLAAQTASALEKARLSQVHETKHREAEREQFLSTLLSSVSHDFKTPLVTVIGVLSSLKEMSLIKNQPSTLDVVSGGLEEAQKLGRFINNVMEISRLETGVESIHKEPILLRDILASAMKSLHPFISKQRFFIHAAANFPLLQVNFSLMELVFLNLLENALKYGPAEGEIKIITNYNEHVATIDIDDDGDGIPPLEREAIFIKFYRAKHGDRKVAGTGLGLYICRGIVEAHGGTITAIDPHDGQGACVRISFPRSVLVAIDIIEEIEENEAL
jgi:two-component system, OmpR family, sensor histidine kinase KdpD